MPIDITGLPGNHNLLKNKGDSAKITSPTGDAHSSGSTAKQDSENAADTVTLTDTASRLQVLQRSLDDIPVVDTRRVDSIKQAIQSGTYEIDAITVANKLIAFESGLSA